VDSSLCHDSAAAAASLFRSGRLAEARQAYERILGEDPEHPESLYALALIERQLGQLPRALDLLLHLARLDGTRAIHLRELGAVFHQMQQHAPALTALQLATRLDPTDPLAWHLLGVVLYHAERWDDAVAASLEAVKLAPGNADAFQNLGLAVGALRDFEKAADLLGEAVRLDPTSFSAWHNLGNQLLASNRTADAAAAYQRTIALRPDHPDPHINLALALLTQGDLQAGWREYEWRWQGAHLFGERPHPALPRWNGDGAPRTILLSAEQGLGDTLQFSRYAPLVAERGHRVVLETQPELTNLLAHSLGSEAVSVAARGSGGAGSAAAARCNALCPLMSLPGVFATGLTTIPSAPYLRAEDAKIVAWRDRLSGFAAGRRRVGLVWAGNPNNNRRKVDAWRSMPLAALAPLLDLDGIAFVSLQKGEAATALDANPGLPLYDAGAQLADFSETAALVATLDLVVSVDTAVAHLAGGMGKPVWLLSRFNGCWRWLADRPDSPWYPSMRIFRQGPDRSWPPVVKAVRSALAVRFRAG
jgi:tetratricopeptide (TPR) repeat protein